MEVNPLNLALMKHIIPKIMKDAVGTWEMECHENG